ncbi:MAG TPA: hypothetical protein PK413_12750, partial [Thermoanaerobaculia bacterium]|nr:hypothetical protein [Thermoanaerobaculia bacterium]
MADSREPSYYELALNSRQVLGVLVVLLACLLVAFFAGVWIGRDAGPVEQVSNEPPVPRMAAPLPKTP